MQLNLWVIEDVSGGELDVFRHFAYLLNSKVKFFWNNSLMKPDDVPSGNFCLKELIEFMNKFHSGFFKVVYKIIFKYFLIRFYNLSKEFSLISTSYIPIPKGRSVFVYVHTTPRFLNIDKEEFIKEHNLDSNSKKLIFSIFLKFFEINYVSSLRNASLVLCNSNVVKDRLHQFFNIESEVVHFPLNSEIYLPKKYDNFFLCCSRINPIKRQEFVLRAFELFYTNNKDFRLVFVSPTPSKPLDLEYLTKLRRYSTEKKLPVSFLIGLSQYEVIEQFSNCYATLFAAKDEDFGRVLLESLASGKPVISINEGGPLEILVEGITGFLIASEFEMAEKMQYLANNRDCVKEMGENGKNYVSENYSEDMFLKRISEIFKQYQ